MTTTSWKDFEIPIPCLPEYCEGSFSQEGGHYCIASENYRCTNNPTSDLKPKELSCPYYKREKSVELRNIEFNEPSAIGTCTLPKEPERGAPSGELNGLSVRLIGTNDPEKQDRLEECEESARQKHREKLMIFLKRKFGREFVEDFYEE